MQWSVIGSDRNTGADRRLTVSADTEADARAQASAQGVFVSDVVAVKPAGVVKSSSAAKPAHEYVPTPRPPTQDGPEICEAALWMRRSATLLRVFALLMFIAGGMGLLQAMSAGSPEKAEYALSAICGGGLLLAFASLLSFVQAVGMWAVEEWGRAGGR